MDKNKKATFITLFIKGLTAPFDAIKIVKTRKGLKRYFLIPFILNIILLSVIFYLTYTSIYPLLQNIIPQGSAWYLNFLRLIATPFLILAAGLLCILLYSITGSIIIAPLNDPLSAKVEFLLAAKTSDEKFSFTALFSGVVRMVKNVLKLISLLAAYNAVILLFNLIPGFGGIIYSALSLMSAFFFFGFNFFDFPLERRGLEFKEKLRLLWGYKFLNMGLGLGFFILTFIPVLGFFGMNLATIGATALFIEYIEPGLKIAAKREIDV